MTDLLNLIRMMGSDATFPAKRADSDDENSESDSEKTSERKKPCECRYDQFDDHNFDEKFEKCSVKLALRNHITFPSFQMMSEYDDPSMIYYQENHMGLAPRRHWATLIEISHDLSFTRPRLFLILIF